MPVYHKPQYSWKWKKIQIQKREYMSARASVLPNTRFNKHKHVRSSFMSKKKCSYLFPSSSSVFMPSVPWAARCRNPVCQKHFINKSDSTWLFTSEHRVVLVSHLEPPVPAHQPPAAGDDWQLDGDPASLFLRGDTESDNNGTVVAALQARMLFNGGQEVGWRSGVSLRCIGQRGNIKTLFWWLYVTFVVVTSCMTPTDFLHIFFETQSLYVKPNCFSGTDMKALCTVWCMLMDI